MAEIDLLVVEDHDDTREMLLELARSGGYRAVAASTGTLGLELARQHQPYVALVDLGLPDCDGHELVRWLRGGDGPTLWIVALTGWADQASRKRVLEAGADVHLVKPTRGAEIRTAIDRGLAVVRARRAVR